MSPVRGVVDINQGCAWVSTWVSQDSDVAQLQAMGSLTCHGLAVLTLLSCCCHLMCV